MVYNFISSGVKLFVPGRGGYITHSLSFTSGVTPADQHDSLGVLFYTSDNSEVQTGIYHAATY